MTGFRFTLAYDVRVADVNYGGHVSNAAVLNFFQDARIAYLANLGPYSELDVGEGCGLILPEIRVRYLAEMFLGEYLEIGARIEEIRRSSFAMGYRIERQGRPTAEATAVLVTFEYPTRKIRRVPKPFREAASQFEGLPREA